LYGASEALEEIVGTSGRLEVGSMLGDALGILLGVELGPDDGLEEPVGTSEGIGVRSMLGEVLSNITGDRAGPRRWI
jgi:hypothetical protein